MGAPARRRLRAAVSAGLVAVLASACGNEELPQNTLDPEGPVARQLDELIDPVFVVAGLVFVLVQGLVLYVAVRYRRRSEDEAPKQVHGNVKAEIGWTIAPAVILLVVGVFTVVTVFEINETPAGPGVVKVTVTGRQWWWKYEYPGRNVVTANEMHIPTGQKVDVTLLSDDVVHSFWPPKLAGKVDVVPNRVNKMVIEATTPGTYFGQCAEFCGISHANMRLVVVAHTPAEFERWVASNAAAASLPDPEDEPEAAAGAAAFRARGCASCHTVKGFAAGEVGPDLTHFAQRETFAGAIFPNDERNLRAWLRDPPAEKPGSIMPDLDLTEEEISNLIAYLDTLE
jgi:cytochrome c oxidase subunit 2